MRDYAGELEALVDENRINKFIKDLTPSFQGTSTKARNTKFKPVKFKSKRAAEKDFVEFVGFRGYYNKKKHPIVDTTHTYKEIEVIDPNTNEVIEIEKIYRFKYRYYPGTAHPEPVDENKVIWGILPHEVEAFHKIRRYLKTGIMFKWPRGAGKTYVATWFIEWTMERLAYPWLYLSETAIMSDVAFWIWQWAKKGNQVIRADRGDKLNTYTQFELKNGAVLRIYKYMDEKSVGQHGWYLAFDDIIKKKWSERPSDIKKAKQQWTYALSNIKRKGLMIFGTRKFIGDPLEFLEKVLPKMYIEVKTPYIMEGIFPDWEIVYDDTGKEIIWCPELYTHESLNERKIVAEDDDVDPLEAFNAEMMQDPRSLKGGMVSPEDIEFRKRPHFSENVQMVGIGVDLSWEDEKDTSDMCAVVSCVSHALEIDKKWYKRFTFIKADVDRMPLYDETKNGIFRKGVFTFILEHFKFLRLNYPGIILIIAIERNSGGTIVIKVAQREKFEWIRFCISDKKEAVKWDREGNSNVPIGVVHKKNKIARVFGELQNSIKAHEAHAGHEIQFDWGLEDSVFISQTEGFPKMKHDDGPDSGGMIKDELNRRWNPRIRIRPRESVMVKMRRERTEKSFKEAGAPWLKNSNVNRKKIRVLRR